MKYILVTGGVISGIGKGVVASSVGVILKHCDVPVTSIKIDPYINIDAGTFSPYEHGEVYVLDDGGEVDLDLGNYERFLDITLHRDHNITTGKIYQLVIQKERRGDYLGKTVQVCPHITDAIQGWVESVAKIPVDANNSDPEVCIIELGGTIGDIEGMPFVEAFRQFQFRVGRENFCSIHVSLVPQPGATGEHKTNPTQQSVRELRGLGITPDLIVCRSEKPIDTSIKAKISNFCHIPLEQVINIHDFPTIYHVPLVLRKQGLVDLLSKRLQLNMKITRPRKFMSTWKTLAERAEHLRKQVRIALVGKYTKLEDAYASVIKALNHASLAANHRLKLIYIAAGDLEEKTQKSDPVKYFQAWRELCECQGVLVPGGFGVRGVEGKVAAIHWARTNDKPFLGICLGLQCAVIEFARNELGLKDANNTEIDPNTANPVVIDMPDHTNKDMGGTMRLGKHKTIFKTKDSVLRQLYGNPDYVEERHRHRYEVNPNYVQNLETRGMKFVGHDAENLRMEVMELDGHPYFIAVQYHPEYLSRPMKPSAPYLGLVLASIGKLQNYLSRDCQMTPRQSQSDQEDEEGASTDEEEMANLIKNMSFQELRRADKINQSPSSSSIASSCGDNKEKL